MVKILIVFSSAAKTATGKPAGWYLPEAAQVRSLTALCLRCVLMTVSLIQPYYTFVKAGFGVDFASPGGTEPPVSQSSVDVRLSNPPAIQPGIIVTYDF